MLACDHAEVVQALVEKNGFVPRAWDLFKASGEGYVETLKVLLRACLEWADLVQSEYGSKQIAKDHGKNIHADEQKRPSFPCPHAK